MALVIRLRLSCLITHYNPRWIKYSPALIEEGGEGGEGTGPPIKKNKNDLVTPHPGNRYSHCI